MKDIGDKSIDMILCDLPYGTTACKWDTIIPFEPLWEQYKRIIKDNGAIVLTASQPFTSALVMSNIKMFKYEWIWEKNTGAGFIHAKNRPLKRHENVLVFSKGSMGHLSLLGEKRMKYNPQDLIKQKTIRKNGVSGTTIGDRPSHHDNLISEYTNYPTTILNYKNDNGLHPTQKPVALFEYLIKTYTSVGDLVLDNCAGSGTTAIACINTNRNYILIEKEPKYIEIIKKRIKNTQKSLI
jgi:site-specific DNA-methyltransferase (adenine-specific)